MQDSQRPLILVIDDDAGIREAIVDLLDEEGFATASASNGLEALNYIAEAPQKPALIFLDLMMPTLDGWTFCKIRQATQMMMDIPVIAISAASNLAGDAHARAQALAARSRASGFGPRELREVMSACRADTARQLLS
jgi:CheY-like chemotaxis protein